MIYVNLISYKTLFILILNLYCSKWYQMGQNKDNMLINDLTVVAVIRKFDGVAMYPPQIHPIESSTYFGSTYLIPTSKNLNSSRYDSILGQTNHHNKRVNHAISKYISSV